MVSYANGTDPKHFKMTFYDSLGVFKPIFGNFDFLGLLCTHAAPDHAGQQLKPSKIVKKYEKYVKTRVFSIKMPRTAVKNWLKHP